MIKLFCALLLQQGIYAFTDLGNGVAKSFVLNPDPNPPKIDPLEIQENDIHTKDGKNKNALVDEVHRWPQGVVPFEYHANFTAAARAAVEAAILDYNNYTCIHWRPKTSSDVNYVTFFQGSGCYSALGRNGGQQWISLGLGCEYKGTAIHEMMHSIGFGHEQSRSDRDTYVTIYWNNIAADKVSQFEKYDDTFTTNLSILYDYGSVMHYGAYYFAMDNTKPVMAPIKDPSAVLGQRLGFSSYDVQKIAKYYGCEGTVSTALEVKPKCSINGVQYDDQATFVMGSWLYQCSAQIGSYSYSVYGCVTSTGAQKLNGDTFVEGYYVYKCVISGGSGSRQIVGCATSAGVQKSNGDIYVDGGFVLKCVVTDTSGSQVIAGCLTSDTTPVMKLFGEIWITTAGSVSGTTVGYVRTCTQYGSGYSWKTTKCACTKSDSTVVQIGAGCYNQCATSLFVNCKKATDGVSVSGMSYSSAAFSGVSIC